MVQPIAPYIEPIRKQVWVPGTCEAAFDTFTARIGQWWPRDRYSLFLQESDTAGFEPHVGGELFEVARDGRRAVWGRVVRWDPPHELAFTFHPGRSESVAQTVEVEFAAQGEGTLVTLTHSDWQKWGDGADQARGGYDVGWNDVLGNGFAPLAGGRLL